MSDVIERGFRFKQWDIYTDSRELRKKLIATIHRLPLTEKFVIVDQTKRALNSILLNIAEGSNKTTDKDRRLYINRAHGSLDEVVSCLDCMLDDGYINETEYNNFVIQADSLAKRLRGFSNHLSSPT